MMKYLKLHFRLCARWVKKHPLAAALFLAGLAALCLLSPESAERAAGYLGGAALALEPWDGGRTRAEFDALNLTRVQRLLGRVLRIALTFILGLAFVCGLTLIGWRIRGWEWQAGFVQAVSFVPLCAAFIAALASVMLALRAIWERNAFVRWTAALLLVVAAMAGLALAANGALNWSAEGDLKIVLTSATAVGLATALGVSLWKDCRSKA